MCLVKKDVWYIGGKKGVWYIEGKKGIQKGRAIPIGLLASIASPILGEVAKP